MTAPIFLQFNFDPIESFSISSTSLNYTVPVGKYAKVFSIVSYGGLNLNGSRVCSANDKVYFFCKSGDILTNQSNTFTTSIINLYGEL